MGEFKKIFTEELEKSYTQGILYGISSVRKLINESTDYWETTGESVCDLETLHKNIDKIQKLYEKGI